MLLDAGRTDVLADEVGRQALHCIRCSACLNVCPVYSRVGGHAYESVYPGPIGAILTPQLQGLDQAPTLPWASSLCGACYDACPVKIDIPTVLVHLRGRVVREAKSRFGPERLAWTPSAASSAPAAPTSGRSASPGGPRAAAARAVAGLEHDARPAGGAERLLPRVVGEEHPAAAPRAAARTRSTRRRGRTTHERARGRPRPHPYGAGRTAVPDVPRDYHGAGAGAVAGDPAVVARFASGRRVPGDGPARRRGEPGRCGCGGAAEPARAGSPSRRRPPPRATAGSASPTSRRSRRATRRARRRRHRLRGGDRRDGTVILDGGARSGRRRSRSCPTSTSASSTPRTCTRRPGRRSRPGRRRREGPAHLRLRPERDVRHRARAGGGRPRAPHARDPRRGAVSRAALLLALTLAVLPASASAAVPAALGPDGRESPLLGGGARAPRTACRRRSCASGCCWGRGAGGRGGRGAALPGGALRRRADGRGATLPDPPGGREDLALAGASDAHCWRAPRRRAAPPTGAAAWAELPRPAAIPASFVPDTLRAPGGLRARWSPHDVARGRRHRHARSRRRTCSPATAAPDGTIVLAFGGSDRLLALPPGAPARELRRRARRGRVIGILPLPAAIPGVRATSSPWTSSAAARPWRRPPARVRARHGRRRSVRGAGRPAGRDRARRGGAPARGRGQPRAARGAARNDAPLAAVAPATYAALRRGAVAISSTFAGAAGIEVRSGGAVVTSAIARSGRGRRPVAAGPPAARDLHRRRAHHRHGRPQAWHRMRVRHLAPALARRGAAARPAVPVRAALARTRPRDRPPALRARGDAASPARPSRSTRRRRADRRRCASGVWFARLRPDGLQGRVREAPRACRERGPVR